MCVAPWSAGEEHAAWLKPLAELGTNRAALRKLAAAHGFALEPGSGWRESAVRGMFRRWPAQVKGILARGAGGLPQRRTVISIECPSEQLPNAGIVPSAPAGSQPVVEAPTPADAAWAPR